MLFFRKVVDPGGLVFLIDAAFPSVSFHVCDFVDCKCMLSVDGGTVDLLGCCDGLLWRLVFDESIASRISVCSASSRNESEPFRHALVVDWHEEAIFLDFPRLVQQLD